MLSKIEQNQIGLRSISKDGAASTAAFEASSASKRLSRQSARDPDIKQKSYKDICSIPEIHDMIIDHLIRAPFLHELDFLENIIRHNPNVDRVAVMPPSVLGYAITCSKNLGSVSKQLYFAIEKAHRNFPSMAEKIRKEGKSRIEKLLSVQEFVRTKNTLWSSQSAVIFIRSGEIPSRNLKEAVKFYEELILVFRKEIEQIEKMFDGADQLQDMLGLPGINYSLVDEYETQKNEVFVRSHEEKMKSYHSEIKQIGKIFDTINRILLMLSLPEKNSSLKNECAQLVNSNSTCVLQRNLF